MPNEEPVNPDSFNSEDARTNETLQIIDALIGHFDPKQIEMFLSIRHGMPIQQAAALHRMSITQAHTLVAKMRLRIEASLHASQSASTTSDYYQTHLRRWLTDKFGLWIRASKTASPYESPLKIDVFIDPGDAPETDIRSVLSALNEVHVASGGLGLEFSVDDTFVLSGIEVSR